MDFISNVIANHPKRVLATVFVVLIPIFSFFWFHNAELHCDVRRGFADQNGRAISEFQRFSVFHNMSFEGLEIWGILVKSRTANESLVMSSRLLNEINRLNRYVHDFEADFGGQRVSYNETAASELNHVFEYYHKLYTLDEWMPGINLSFPMASAFGTNFFLGNQFFGVNPHRVSPGGRIERVRFVGLWYMGKAANFTTQKRLQAVQMGLFAISSADNFSKYFSFEMFGDQVANAEMLRGTLRAAQLFVVGAALMVGVMAFTFSDLTIKSQIFLIIGAIGSPLTATLTCFSLLGWFGQPFNSIMCIAPFLILGIGVDDAFLLLHCWRRESSRLGGPDSTKDRMRNVVAEISPSMAITSLTNIMAFSVGFLSPTPQMSSFCLCTALAILLDFIFEFLIFAPLMVLFYEPKTSEKQLLAEAGRKLMNWQRFSDALLSHPGKFLGGLVYICIVALSVHGFGQLFTTFDPSKTFPSDSKLVGTLADFDFVQQEYTPINYLTRLPDLNNETSMSNFELMMNRLETRKNCYGKQRSHNMYWDYVKFVRDSNDSTLGYNRLEEFFRQRGIDDNRMIKFHRDGNETVADTLNFVVVCRGERDWPSRAAALELSRSVIDEFPEFDASLFDYDATIYDLIITVKGELIKSVLITFMCMTIACFVMMPSLLAPTVASAATLSISFCLVGFLSLWGQNLDPVTMIDIIMAIGFSVDYSAHVCFHYYCACRTLMPGETRGDVIAKVLNSVGRPLLEASLTTFLCMLPLFFVPVYIIESFAKTVVLVTSLGLLHGLLFVPILLHLVPLPNQQRRFMQLPTDGKLTTPSSLLVPI